MNPCSVWSLPRSETANWAARAGGLYLAVMLDLDPSSRRAIGEATRVVPCFALFDPIISGTCRPKQGTTAIHIARTFCERRRNFVGQHFWARGYFVSTVGRDEAVVRAYIKHQEAEDRRMDQLLLL